MELTQEIMSEAQEGKDVIGCYSNCITNTFWIFES